MLLLEIFIISEMLLHVEFLESWFLIKMRLPVSSVIPEGHLAYKKTFDIMASLSKCSPLPISGIAAPAVQQLWLAWQPQHALAAMQRSTYGDAIRLVVSFRYYWFTELVACLPKVGRDMAGIRLVAKRRMGWVLGGRGPMIMIWRAVGGRTWLTQVCIQRSRLTPANVSSPCILRVDIDIVSRGIWQFCRSDSRTPQRLCAVRPPTSCKSISTSFWEDSKLICDINFFLSIIVYGKECCPAMRILQVGVDR